MPHLESQTLYLSSPGYGTISGVSVGGMGKLGGSLPVLIVRCVGQASPPSPALIHVMSVSELPSMSFAARDYRLANCRKDMADMKARTLFHLSCNSL